VSGIEIKLLVNKLKVKRKGEKIFHRNKARVRVKNAPTCNFSRKIEKI
jgi:hypothetical protein